jgi:hypothetical protein
MDEIGLKFHPDVDRYDIALRATEPGPSHSRHMHPHPFASRFSAVLCFVRFEEESE